MSLFIAVSIHIGGDDYSSITQILTFTPTVSTQTVSVPIINNDVLEPEENFEGILSVSTANSRLTLRPDIANIVIGDNDREF